VSGLEDGGSQSVVGTASLLTSDPPDAQRENTVDQ